MPRAFIHRSAFFTLFLFFIFSPDIGSCQQLVYKFKQFTTNEGLPSSEVHQVLRDSRNFMWFATDHGVCRYDGYRFETFNLPDNSILSMYEDVKKRIWIASFSGQLFYYENGKFYDYKYNDVVVRMINQAAINRFYVDSLDNVYISTTTPDCFFINTKGIIKELFRPDRNCLYNAFEINNGKFFSYMSGSFMAGNEFYFTRFNYSSFITIKAKRGNYQIRFPSVVAGRKSGVKYLSDGTLIFYCGNFLFKIYLDGKYIFRKMENNILDVVEMDTVNLLVATIQNGLYILNKKNETVENYFQQLTVTSVEKDYEGGLWVSTTQAGVFYLNSLQMKHFSDKQIIIGNKILCLEIEKDSSIWAGGESGSIFHFRDGKRLSNYNFPIISVNGIHSGLIPNAILICAGSYDKKYVGKFLIYKYEGKNFIIIQGISDIIRSNGQLISGKVGGVIRLNFNRRTVELQSKDFFRVSSIFQDNKENILIGNLFGLWRFRDGELEFYDSTKPILRSRITDINEYKNHYLLLGTRGKGFLISLNDSLYQLTTADGLASDNIRKIFVDENIIWLATNRGISRLAIQSLYPFRYSIRNISVQDGLLSNEVNDIKRLDSNIVIATNGGISVFNRNMFDSSKQMPLSLYVTGIKINGLDTTINDRYFLNYTKRNLSLSFVALSYRESTDLEYRYRLSGIDSNWVYTSSKEIQLNPLPFGRYIVEIQARRQGEIWVNRNGLSISINRSLPFWKTTWFWISTFLLAAFLMLLFFINRTKKIRQREKERTELNKKLGEMELKALRAQMNPHFIFNILNSIQYFIIHNENDEAQRYMSKFAKLVRLTLDNSRSTFITLADEISLLRLYIELEKIRFEERFDYKVDIKDNVSINSIRIPNMLLQPYVENSIKHGFKSKQIKYFLDISVFKKEDKIVCMITDNGIGREKAALIPDAELEKHASTGTTIVQEKIEALKFYYNYDLNSQTDDLKDEKGNGIGTKVTLTFPEQFDLTNTI